VDLASVLAGRAVNQALVFGLLGAGGVLLVHSVTGSSLADVVQGKPGTVSRTGATIAGLGSAVGGLGGTLSSTAAAIGSQAVEISGSLSDMVHGLAVTGPVGPTQGPNGLSTWTNPNGSTVQVASWIIPELQYARAHGWTGEITSGYRPESGSEHALTQYPGGAVDFGGGWVSGGEPPDPAALANRNAFIEATQGYTGLHLLTPIGFIDMGHMSGNGH
jgi:hypothetical protein